MEKIVELWQQATIDETRMDRTYGKEDLVPVIMALEKKQQQVLRFKTWSILILLPAIAILFLNRASFSLNSIAGLGILMISVMVVVVMLNRRRFQITYAERGLSTLELAGIAERRIYGEKRMFTTYLPLFVVVALAGFNLMYADYFSGEEAVTRFLYHLGMTGGLLIAFLLGLSVRIRRFHRQFLPVLSRIRKFKREAKEGS